MNLYKTQLSSGSDDRWLVTFASLLTAVLAFFILLITMKSNESKSTFQVADNLTQEVYNKIINEKKDYGLSWLEIENTGTFGIRIVIPSFIDDRSMFRSNSDIITEKFLPYINSLSIIIKNLELDKLVHVNKKIIQNLKKQEKVLSLEVLIQGHTDALPVRDGKFKNNWDLSTARAYSFMNIFQEKTELPLTIFSIAGYGPFLPKRYLENYSENRRVEVFIKFQLESINNNYAAI